MHLQTLQEIIEKSAEFKDFKKKNKNAELIAIFIIFNIINKQGDYSFDYRIGKEKIASFTISAGKKEINLKEEEILDKTKELNSLDLKKVNIEIDKVEHLIREKMLINNLNKPLEKMIAVLHKNLEGEIVWNLTCICQGLIIISAIIDADKGKFLKFDKKGLFDFALPIKRDDRNTNT